MEENTNYLRLQCNSLGQMLKNKGFPHSNKRKRKELIYKLKKNKRARLLLSSEFTNPKKILFKIAAWRSSTFNNGNACWKTPKSNNSIRKNFNKFLNSKFLIFKKLIGVHKRSLLWNVDWFWLWIANCVPVCNSLAESIQGYTRIVYRTCNSLFLGFFIMLWWVMRGGGRVILSFARNIYHLKIVFILFHG